MGTEALENIVCDTDIDRYSPGTAALYMRLSRDEEEKMYMEEEARREIDGAIRDVYTSGPGFGYEPETPEATSQWSLDITVDQSNYELDNSSQWALDNSWDAVQEEACSYNVSYDVAVEPELMTPVSNGLGYSSTFDTYIEPEPELPLHMQMLEGVSSGLENIDYTLQMQQSELQVIPRPEDMGYATNPLLDVEPEPPVSSWILDHQTLSWEKPEITDVPNIYDVPKTHEMPLSIYGNLNAGADLTSMEKDPLPLHSSLATHSIRDQFDTEAEQESYLGLKSASQLMEDVMSTTQGMVNSVIPPVREASYDPLAAISSQNSGFEKHGPDNLSYLDNNFKVELNPDDFYNPDKPSTLASKYLSLTPRLDFVEDEDTPPHLNLDMDVLKSSGKTIKGLGLNKIYEQKGFSTHYYLFDDED